MTTERHPLQPFLPEGATHLFLGSFPPPRSKWSMDFFYPNFINDFWRVMGLLHYADADHFVAAGGHRFDRDAIVRFCTQRGLALYDTATVVRRLRDNASDAHLDIVQPTDVMALVRRLPSLRHVVATGGKAATEVARALSLTSLPDVGTAIDVHLGDRTVRFWRMPSTSRAYPLALAKKAACYSRLFDTEGGS